MLWFPLSDDDADQAPSAERPSWRLVTPRRSALLPSCWRPLGFVALMGDGRSRYNAVFCGAHVCSMRPMAIIVFVIIGFDHDAVLRSGECAFVSLLLSSGQFGSRFSCLSLVMRGRHVELWIGLFFDVWPWVFRVFRWVGWLGVSCDFGFERHVSLIWRSWCHAHDARYCVRVTIGGTRVLVPKRVLCACCGFPECPDDDADQAPSAERPSWRLW